MNLMPECHKQIFKDMEIQAQIPAVDYYLMRVCKAEINKKCRNTDQINVRMSNYTV